MKRGFTLIELLVVVLIIGILSAIALPQYQKAVEKSRFTDALLNISALQRAIDVYIMENGFPQEDDMEFLGNNKNGKNILPIDVAARLDCSVDSGNKCSSRYFVYEAYCGSGSCIIDVYRRKDGNPNNPGEYNIEWDKNSDGSWIKNWNPTNAYSESLCKPYCSQPDWVANCCD